MLVEISDLTIERFFFILDFAKPSAHGSTRAFSSVSAELPFANLVTSLSLSSNPDDLPILLSLASF